MSKYDPLWHFIEQNGSPLICLSFADIKAVTGLNIDHSFLTYKKELKLYGYRVGNISLKNGTVTFIREEGQE